MIERNQVILSILVPLPQKESNGNVYCATKHAVDALNQGMRMDLNLFGIRGCHPGMVQLNLVKCVLKGDTDRAGKVYQGFTPCNQKICRYYSFCSIETVSCQYCRFSRNEYCTSSSTIIKD
jgi:NADP-dependent 3-hydroxy acid dehydrogenase YdfG